MRSPVIHNFMLWLFAVINHGCNQLIVRGDFIRDKYNKHRVETKQFLAAFGCFKPSKKQLKNLNVFYQSNLRCF